MTAQTSEALLTLLEADPNYIPLRSRERYDITAKPSERAESINAQSPQLLLSIHGNSAPEGSAASGFECYPSVLAEQCFVTSEEDVARFGSEDGCKAVARIYYEAICAYFGTQPLDTPQS